MKQRTMILIGIVAIFLGLFLNKIKIPEVNQDGLTRPSDEIVAMVESLPNISDAKDSAKLSGVFNAMSEKLSETPLSNNLSVQYFFDFVGKKSIGDELMDGDNKKYPEFSPMAAQLIANVIGEQTEEEPLTDEEKKRLSNLLYGFSWKLYHNNEKNTFEQYKNKAISAISEYNREIPDETPDDEDGCICEGKGYIIHGDGHRTPCPCIESGNECQCNPKCGSK
tara:strand:- start:5236 stop:5904 length:669 start_codon:yes stop_codon:yes gene_type:complete